MKRFLPLLVLPLLLGAQITLTVPDAILADVDAVCLEVEKALGVVGTTLTRQQCAQQLFNRGLAEFKAAADQTSGQTTAAATTDAFLISAFCGDGILVRTFNERCDDGNTTPGDGCSATCQVEP